MIVALLGLMGFCGAAFLALWAYMLFVDRKIRVPLDSLTIHQPAQSE